MGSYFLIVGTYLLEAETHIGYGIGYRSRDQVICFEDLTTDLPSITDLISLCNKLKLAPIHLEDVVEDFIS